MMPTTVMIPTKSRDIAVRRLDYAQLDEDDVVRAVPVEAPLAIEVMGTGYAVMMATPADLQDFAVGFALCEGLIHQPSDLRDVSIHATEGGWILRLTVPAAGAAIALERARHRLSESSCGLCGLENIQQALRALPPVVAHITTSRRAIRDALEALNWRQPLGRTTGATHAAAFCEPDGTIRCVREDVGRHNALDKLIGALALAGTPPSEGFMLLTARCSYELVGKVVIAGCPMLVTISAPTTLAVERAIQAGLVLVSLARHDSALVVCDPHGSIVS